MIALTHLRPERMYQEQHRQEADSNRDPSGFGEMSLVVGTAATQLGINGPLKSNHAGPMTAAPFRAVCDTMLQAGMHLGPFRLLKRLGRGAQGDVWKARRTDPCLELVALKVLNPSLAKNPCRIAQFRREAERGTRLSGPSLLQVSELGEIEGFLYMAMPFIEGITLHEVIKTRRAYLAGEDPAVTHGMVAMDEETYLRTAVRIMAKAARALAIVHEKKVAHRDVKPSNILLDRYHTHGVYLCDLGLARDLDVATPEQMRDGAGTPMYMAPERLVKAPADEILCDLYSLGVTLCETLTLNRPFQIPDGMPTNCLFAYLSRATPRPPRELKPDLPAELESIILKAMAQDPKDRYSSARELADDLDRFLVRWIFLARRTPVERPHQGWCIPQAPMARTIPTPHLGTAAAEARREAAPLFIQDSALETVDPEY